MPPREPRTLARLLQTASKIEPHETKSVLLAFLFVFILMAAYYILRPVRDALASDWTDIEVATLWNLNFVVSTALVAGYGWAMGRIPFRLLVPAVYTAFATSFLAFYLGVKAIADHELIDQAFYVWVSVFGVFHVSVFWSYMAELFDKDQARRVFAFISAGASAGALAGPAIPALFATALGPDQLLLVASLLLMVPVPLIFHLDRLRTADRRRDPAPARNEPARIGGNPFAGFWMFVTNPFLLAIGAFILLHNSIGAFIYFEQKNLLEPYAIDMRTHILGLLDWVTNILTIGVGLFVTGRVTTRFGMPATLAMVPICILAGLLILAFAPMLTLILVIQVVRRVGEYAVLRPGRETMFTVVDRATRFKAKPVIDVVVYRASDAASGAAFAGLTEVVGLGLSPVAAIGAGIAAVWTVLAIHLGRVFERDHGRLARTPDAPRTVCVRDDRSDT